MTATIEFFPVGNGDMTLITLESGRKILIDINIRNSADDDIVDVAALLKKRLNRDANSRLYVDVFLLSHPDQDHCRGLEEHFYLKAPQKWKKSDDKIFIREMWSSPIVFRRKKQVEGSICNDADKWWDEARRRVKNYKDASDKSSIQDGDLIQILGEDKDGKTENLDILVKTNEKVTKICGKEDKSFEALLLAPLLVTEDKIEQLTGKNHSSTVLRFKIKSEDNKKEVLFLTGGDAEVENWERIWQRNKNQADRLEYNILQAPHHCSWHSLSYDSWKEKKENASVSMDARQALSQVGNKAFVIASSKKIEDNNDDPPCIRAKHEYETILQKVGGFFLCVADECDDNVLLFEISNNGLTKVVNTNKQPKSFNDVLLDNPPKTDKKRGESGGRYA